MAEVRNGGSSGSRGGKVGSTTKTRQVVIQGFESKSGLGKRVAEELEEGILQVACPEGEALAEGTEQYKVYKNQYKRLCTHMRRNPALLRRLADGELKAKDVASMDDKVLMADTQKSELEQFRQEGLKEVLGQQAEESAHWTPSDQFVCPRCDCVKCVYIQLFKGFHSHDDNNQEPVITIRCTACLYLWKEDEVEGGRMAAGTLTTEETKETPYGKVAEPGSRVKEAPAIWAETDRSREPTWMLPSDYGDKASRKG
eukprot:TRINITY_DN24898_c0_g2_i1.p1 TRINITY_DN24898_c0_g2~~TRINITY_DN24898_c0_g2_i1.p1  ORF type:complete len:256 (-),score=42.93 TRINITY_DN24898_c0_g2_i1:82-849(-)